MNGIVWKCDRCGKISDNYADGQHGPMLPADWHKHGSMPVRGSTGARSQREVTLCDECDDSLYAWLTRHHIGSSSDPADDGDQRQ